MPKVISQATAACHSHPSIDSSCRFALDHLLRRAGFMIWQRKGPRRSSLWRRQGRLYSQEQALATLKKDDVLDAAYAEDLYHAERCEQAAGPCAA